MSRLHLKSGGSLPVGVLPCKWQMLCYSGAGYIVNSLLIREKCESSELAHPKDEISQVFLSFNVAVHRFPHYAMDKRWAGEVSRFLTVPQWRA